MSLAGKLNERGAFPTVDLNEQVHLSVTVDSPNGGSEDSDVDDSYGGKGKILSGKEEGKRIFEWTDAIGTTAVFDERKDKWASRLKSKTNAKLIRTQEEVFNKGFNWFAYFKGKPSEEDLRSALEGVYGKDVDPEEVFYQPERMNTKLSRETGLERWYICQSV